MVKPHLQQDISIIIPVHNGGDSFKRCLIALEKLNPQQQEVIVVANGDTDGSSSVAEQFGLTVVCIPTAIGLAVARNIGDRIAKGKYLLFIDADVEIQLTTIGDITNIFTQNPQLSALMGSYDDSPGVINFLSQYRNLLHHYTHQIACEDASTFWTGCGAITRDIFLKIGGFSEHYLKPCIEDIELGIRLKQAGYTSQLYKDLQVKHLKHWTALSILNKLTRLVGLPGQNDIKTIALTSVGIVFFTKLEIVQKFWKEVLGEAILADQIAESSLQVAYFGNMK